MQIVRLKQKKRKQKEKQHKSERKKKVHRPRWIGQVVVVILNLTCLLGVEKLMCKQKKHTCI